MGYKSILAGVWAFLAMAMVPGKGHLKFDESFKDLGDVKQGGVTHCSFAFTNSGDHKFKIFSVVAASDCLNVHPIKDSIIDVDAGGEIQIDFDTNKRKKGEFAFGITVTSNADNREVKLKMFGTLVE
jgi:hypothetical protein